MKSNGVAESCSQSMGSLELGWPLGSPRSRMEADARPVLSLVQPAAWKVPALGEAATSSKFQGSVFTFRR
jgi:hypothetical protein